ncbi:MAG: hypothetical protein ACRCSP_06660 [Rhodoglobus sp.]
MSNYDMTDGSGMNPEENTHYDVTGAGLPPASVAVRGGNGWDDAALAIHSIQQIDAPMVVLLHPEGFPPAYLDFQRRVFHWRSSMEDFPLEPAFVRVETEAVTPDSPSPFRAAGRSLDKLLWAVGQSAFEGNPAPWLTPGERYKLTSWPNFTELNHTFDHMRMTAQIGNSSLNAGELATAAHSEHTAVQRMINAYSLMGILQVSEETPPATPTTSTESATRESVGATPAVASTGPEHTARSGSLFARLRSRWGL